MLEKVVMSNYVSTIQVWLQAVKLTLEILPDCDAIDLNLGCPQVGKLTVLWLVKIFVGFTLLPGDCQKRPLWILLARRVGVVGEDDHHRHCSCRQTHNCQIEGLWIHGENGGCTSSILDSSCLYLDLKKPLPYIWRLILLLESPCSKYSSI